MLTKDEIAYICAWAKSGNEPREDDEEMPQGLTECASNPELYQLTKGALTIAAQAEENEKLTKTLKLVRDDEVFFRAQGAGALCHSTAETLCEVVGNISIAEAKARVQKNTRGLRWENEKLRAALKQAKDAIEFNSWPALNDALDSAKELLNES